MNDPKLKSWPTQNWKTCEPSDITLNGSLLTAAIDYHKEVEADANVNLAQGLNSISGNQDAEEWSDVLGPTKPRGAPNGLILRHGKVVAAWGDTERVDMTFSATKSYLAILVGVAVEQQLVGDIDDPMRHYALDAGFDSSQNREITWRQALQQASEWEGTLWGKPDLVDRHRQVGVDANNSKKGTHRPLQKPGTFYEYNDVRVNRLSLSLMQVFRRPLPEVLKETIMDPIGASESWEWYGYNNSWVVVDGIRMQSVPGGGHWGGGLWISSRDHALFGSLILNKGIWQSNRIISEEWIKAICEPSPCNPNYGFMWWLNSEQKLFPSAPESSFFAIGAGQNIVWIDQQLDLVAVFRWIKQKNTDDLIAKVMSAIF